jgi:signal transduction histidine kinase
MESNQKSSEVLLYVVIGILMMVTFAITVMVFANRAQKRLLQQRMNNQALQLQHQQELLERNLLVQEEERQNIAAQLHDDIGSKLGVLSLTFHRLQRMGSQSEPIISLFSEINDLIANTLDSTRRISHELLPPTLEDFGLIEALTEFCEGIRKTGAVDIQFEYKITRADIKDSAVELNLFRIVQELTNNSLKYAFASKITLQLMKNKDNISLHYQDNGNGFDFENTVSKGLGLKNLENRVKMIEGVLNIKSSLGNGFEAIILLNKT